MSDTDLAINILGEGKVCCLRNLFEALEGLPPQVGRLRYRADNKTMLDTLDNLESSAQLIRRDEKSEHYRLSPYALPLIQSKKSKILIALMENIYSVLKDIYMEQLTEPVTYKEISKRLDASPIELREAVYYMCEAHDVWSGKDSRFPFSDDSHINISESVIKKEKFIDVLEDYYRWNVIPAKNQNTALDHFLDKSDRTEPLLLHIKNKAFDHPVVAIIILVGAVLGFSVTIVKNIGDIFGWLG
ncbi:MAG: hypothetical protein AB2540_10580 [Candidatus Thiodiazotropha endolucinida]